MANNIGAKHWIKVNLWQVEYIVRLGDVVWFYPGCSMTSAPQTAVITAISEDSMIDLAILNPDVARKIGQKGVCLVGSDVLVNNKVHQTKGCWVPRTPTELIASVADREG